MARRVLPVVVGLGLNLLATPQVASAHARLVDTAPRAGAAVNAPPDQVVLYFDSKPTTVEGDPVQVYAPTGERVDLGDATVSDDGTNLTVRLERQSLPRGDYQVVYRVISEDTHLITGRFSFRSQRGSEQASATVAAPARGPASAPSRLTSGCADCGRWPWAMAGAGAFATLVGATGLRWRRHRREMAARVVPLQRWASHRRDGRGPEVWRG